MATDDDEFGEIGKDELAQLAYLAYRAAERRAARAVEPISWLDIRDDVVAGLRQLWRGDAPSEDAGPHDGRPLVEVAFLLGWSAIRAVEFLQAALLDESLRLDLPLLVLPAKVVGALALIVLDARIESMAAAGVLFWDVPDPDEPIH